MPVAKKKPRVVVFPFDCLTKKEQRKILKGGPIVAYNVYDKYKDLENLPSKDQLKLMDRQECLNIMETVKAHNSSSKIAKALGYKSTSGVYGFYRSIGLDIENTPTSRTRKKSTRNKKETPPAAASAPEPQANPIKDKMTLEEVIDTRIKANVKEIIEAKALEAKVNGFSISFNGEFTGEQIETKVLAIATMLMDQGLYDIELKVIEKEIPRAELPEPENKNEPEELETQNNI